MHSNAPTGRDWSASSLTDPLKEINPYRHEHNSYNIGRFKPQMKRNLLVMHCDNFLFLQCTLLKYKQCIAYVYHGSSCFGCLPVSFFLLQNSNYAFLWWTNLVNMHKKHHFILFFPSVLPCLYIYQTVSYYWEQAAFLWICARLVGIITV